MQLRRVLLHSLPVFFALGPAAFSADRFLTIGGGYAPAGNQISLERNIVFYQKVLDSTGHGQSPHDLYFADGDAPGRDVQFEPENSGIPTANRYMAKLFFKDDNLDLDYRDNQLEGITGATSIQAIESWFRETGSKLKAGDRIILYATAHGGKSVDKKNPYDTKLYLWNTKYILAKRLAQLISDLPEKVGVTLVMAQCYSGGFSHVLFEDANKKNADQDRQICGFFSTIQSRMAAGCTAAIDEENYDEFSSHFWAALLGESRVGKAIESADYDQDGVTTFEEAHAYTILHSETIDIPIKTSGEYLRARSKFGSEEHPGLLAQATPYSQVFDLAAPIDRVLLERLSDRLKLRGENRHDTATKKAGELAKGRKELLDLDKQKKRSFDAAKSAIKNSLLGKWPELSNIMTPEAVSLLTDNREEFVAAVESHSSLPNWESLETERDEIEEKRQILDEQWVQYQRFLRVFESVILGENLKRLDDKPAQARLNEIRTAEKGSLKKSS